MDALEFGRLALRYVHLLGMALLVGGLAVQLFAQKFRMNTAAVVGVITQLATGVALSAPWGRDEDLDSAKLGVKLLLGILLAIMVLVPRKKESVAAGHFYATCGMVLLTVGVAVFWT